MTTTASTRTIAKGIATAAAITATFFATTACGTETAASGTISKPAQAPSAEKSYPADGRENRFPDRGPATGDHKAPTE